MPPRVVAAERWSYVVTDSGSEDGSKTHKPKPGYKAKDKGARLLVDTSVSGNGAFSIGFLRTYTSQAVARLSCVAPCTCQERTVYAGTTHHTSTTVMDRTHTDFDTPGDGPACRIQLELTTEGEIFKFIALHVY